MRTKLLATLMAAGLLAAAANSARAQSDAVRMMTGSPKRGTVTAMTATEVKLSVGGTETSIPVNEMRDIRFDGEPAALENARNALAQRNYNSVLTEIAKVDLASLSREFEKQEAAFLKAYALAQQAMTEGGDKQAAEAALREFTRATGGKHYRFYPAAEALGDLAVASGKFEDAVNYYGDKGLAGAPWPEYKLRANLALGRAQYLGGKFEDALASYEAVISASAASPEVNALKQLAMAGKGACLGETGKHEEGIALLQELIKVNDPQDKKLFAWANNALGICYLKANRPKDAALAFMHTDVLFFVEADAHAEALYYLAKLGDQLNKSKLASDARDNLRQRYAGSFWLGKQ